MRHPNDDWEFNVLNIYNFNKPGPYSFIFDFLKEDFSSLGGDILEAGVFRGRMTLGMGIFLSSRGIPGTIHGFDTFEGFPDYAPQDDVANFRSMKTDGIITQEHFNRIQLLQFYNRELLGRGISAIEISSSGNFIDSHFSYLKKKIEFFELNNISLHVGPFEKTMQSPVVQTNQYSLVFIDCDLYSGYLDTLKHCWPRLLPGGVIFLDEYYSLKFPGARVAVDEFLTDKSGFKFVDVSSEFDDFERWVIKKDV